MNGEPAPYEAPIIQVGGLEAYEARCRRCHEVPSASRDQTSLLDALGSGADNAVVLTHESLRRRA